MTFEYFQEIVNDYEKLFETEKGYDVIIYAGNEILKEIRAHSLILRTRSQYFCAAFSNEWVEKENGKFIFKKPNISSQTFKIILRFIYCGKIDFTGLQGPEILKLLIAADELDIQTLISCIQKYLIENKDEFLKQNLIETLQTVYQHEQFTNLRDYCFEKIKIIFNSDRFTSLEAPLVEFLLKRDDLNIDEIEIWENLIRWGLAQKQVINQDVSKWNQYSISAFRELLCKFIPLIRFYAISFEDYSSKVKPYEEILSKELREENLKFYVVPGYQPTLNLLPRRSVDSNLINLKHVALFANWIDKKEESTNITEYIRALPYEFNLLYRASRDGNTAEAFHDKCDHKGATITVIKIKDSKQIIGGYNPFFWNTTNATLPTKDSFIFSFTNRMVLQTAKVVYSNGGQHSIGLYLLNGPVFGRSDLYKNSNGTWHSYPSSYPILYLGLPSNFYADDYEVFQVTKK